MVIHCLYRVLNLNKQCFVKTVIYSENISSLTRQFSSQIGSTQNEKWDLLSAVSLERKPITARKLNPTEEKMFNMLSQVELEKSSKSEHELQLLLEKVKLEQLKKGDSKIDLDNIPEKTAQDFEDASQEELKNFIFANRETDADKTNDTKSLDRQLDRNLLLLVKEKIGGNPVWVLPQGIRQEGETLRQTAERVLVEKCGDEVKAQFFGNAPIGFYKYKYSKKVRQVNNNSAVGAKVFFFKAHLTEGNVKIDKNTITDYQWALRTELNILPKDYKKSVTMFLIDEDH